MNALKYLCIALVLIAKVGIAQDTIIQTDGTTIIGSVLEVGTSEIKYKKYRNVDSSPIYDIEKYNVRSIKYADGTVDLFNATPPPLPAYTLTYPQYPNYNSGNINNSSIFFQFLFSLCGVYSYSSEQL